MLMLGTDVQTESRTESRNKYKSVGAVFGKEAKAAHCGTELILCKGAQMEVVLRLVMEFSSPYCITPKHCQVHHLYWGDLYEND